MHSVLIEFPGGAGVVAHPSGEICLTHDVSDGRGSQLEGRGYRPVKAWIDQHHTLVGGLLPPGAVSAEVIDDRETRVAAVVHGRVYAAVLAQANDGHEPVVCCRDASAAPVSRPLPADWTRTRVTDAEEPCPACGAIAYDEVLPTDDSRGSRGTLGPDGPLEPCRIVVCRLCGHEEGAGGSLMRFTSPDDEDEAATVARTARHHAKAREHKWYSDTMTLRNVTFPVYAAEAGPATIHGSRSSDHELTELTIAHHAGEDDGPFTASDLTVATAIGESHDDVLAQARRALESWIHGDRLPVPSETLSDAAMTLWFAATAREARGAALGAIRTEPLIAIDGTPESFLMLSTASGRWVAVRRHADLTVTIAARNLDPTTLILEPIGDPTSRLLDH